MLWTGWEQKSVTLEDVLRVVAEQGKAISELTQAVKNLVTPEVGTSRRTSSNLQTQPQFTEEGKPICFSVSQRDVSQGIAPQGKCNLKR